MGHKGRDRQRLTAVYDLFFRRQLSRYEGSRSFAARLQRQIHQVEYQFLPHFAGRVPAWRLLLRKLGGSRTLPDFACAGAIKSGTTDLAVYLGQHPCLIPPLSKEIAELSPAAWRQYYPTQAEKDRTARVHGAALCGIFSPQLHSLAFIEAYHAARPDARAILMLRNPVERAYSHYKWDLFLGGKSLHSYPFYRSFGAYVEAALDLFPGVPLYSRSANPLLQSGIYVHSTRRWLERFGSDQVHVLRAEDFFTDPSTEVRAIHRFLGIPPLAPEVHDVVLRNPVPAPPLDQLTRQRLEEFYRPWNEQLYALLGRDMGW